MIPSASDINQMSQVAQHGSPVLLAAFGRIFGMGPAERRAAFGENGGGVPTWTWVLLAATAGVVAGVRVHKRWPRLLPEIIQGD